MHDRNSTLLAGLLTGVGSSTVPVLPAAPSEGLGHTFKKRQPFPDSGTFTPAESRRRAGWCSDMFSWGHRSAADKGAEPHACSVGNMYTVKVSHRHRDRIESDLQRHRDGFHSSASLLSDIKSCHAGVGVSLELALQCPPRDSMLSLSLSLLTKKRLFCAMKIHSKKRRLFPLARSSSCSYYNSLSPSHFRRSDPT